MTKLFHIFHDTARTLAMLFKHTAHQKDLQLLTVLLKSGNFSHE